MSENIHITMLDRKLKEARGKHIGKYFKHRSYWFDNPGRNPNIEHYPIHGSEVLFSYYKGIERINEIHYKFLFRKHIEEKKVFWNLEEISIGVFSEHNADKLNNTEFHYTIIDCEDVSNHEDITITIENGLNKKELVFGKIKTDSPYQNAINKFDTSDYDGDQYYEPDQYIYCRKSNLYYCFILEEKYNIMRVFTIKDEEIIYCPKRYKTFAWISISVYHWDMEQHNYTSNKDKI